MVVYDLPTPLAQLREETVACRQLYFAAFFAEAKYIGARMQCRFLVDHSAVMLKHGYVQILPLHQQGKIAMNIKRTTQRLILQRGNQYCILAV